MRAVVAGVWLPAVCWLVGMCGGGGALCVVMDGFGASFCWFHPVPPVMVTTTIIARHGVVDMADGGRVVGGSAVRTDTTTTWGGGFKVSTGVDGGRVTGVVGGSCVAASVTVYQV